MQAAPAAKSDHLFVSYAWEDGALAEWLTLKLTAEGYRVWCDRFKILGGERWPEDVDAAIRSGTFRMLHLVSKHSVRKPNPVKERELALQLERSRETEILIPLNVDGTTPSELPWRIVDVAYIPFQDWAAGLAQLLKKLKSINAPRPLVASGREIAGSVRISQSVVTNVDEELVSNQFPFTCVPTVVGHFSLSRGILREEAFRLREVWAFKSMGDKRALAFEQPPAHLLRDLVIERTGGLEWHEGTTIDGIVAEYLMTELLGKSLEVHCHKRGLRRDPGGRGFYFPMGLLPRNTWAFQGFQGRRTRVLVCGHRAFLGRKYRYHLGPRFRVRHERGQTFLAELQLRFHLTDLRGVALEHRAAVARRKKIGAGLWNGQWLNRQLAVMSFLADDFGEIGVGAETEARVSVAGASVVGCVAHGIDEDLLASMSAPVGLVDVASDEVREDGD